MTALHKEERVKVCYHGDVVVCMMLCVMAVMPLLCFCGISGRCGRLWHLCNCVCVCVCVCVCGE